MQKEDEIENKDEIEESGSGITSTPKISPLLNGDIYDLTLILGMNF